MDSQAKDLCGRLGEVVGHATKPEPEKKVKNLQFLQPTKGFYKLGIEKTRNLGTKI